MTEPLSSYSPQDLMAAVQQFRDSLPGTARDLAANTAAGSIIHTVEESFLFMEKVASRLTESNQWPVTTEAKRNHDGTLTITVTPA